MRTKNIYYPYFRGKQHEIAVIKDNLALLPTSGICPIIEPVKTKMENLLMVLEQLQTAEGDSIVIANPKVGMYSKMPIGECIEGLTIEHYPRTSIGLLFDGTKADYGAIEYLEKLEDRQISIFHNNMVQNEIIERIFLKDSIVKEHIFISRITLPKAYKSQFSEKRIIQIEDGFNKQLRNSDYPDEETFSVLHSSYKEEDFTGFGDFLIVGNDYSENGGAAHSVAIHMTFFDKNDPKIMRIRHFKSERTRGPTDPGGKYLEALEKLVSFVEMKDSPILKTKAYSMFKSNFDNKHYPGLGYIKRLSMMHHIELLSNYLLKAVR